MENSLTKVNSSKLGLIVSQLRVKQWVKNALVFAPLLFSGERGEWGWFINSLVCAFAFCLVSSASYIFNDISDLEEDRAHPDKQNRPLAAKKLGITSVVILGLLCLGLSFYLAFLVRPTLILIFLLYLLITVAYSLYLKDVIVLDIFCVASGFVLRAVAGALAIHVVLTGWFLLCTTFGAMFIVLEKRCRELSSLKENNKRPHRKVIEQYSLPLIRRMESILVPSILTSYSFYSFQSIHGQWMMITVPFVLYGIMRYQYISESGSLAGAPEEIFWKDRPIQLTLILWTITCWLIIYANPGPLFHQLSSTIDAVSNPK